MGPSHFSLTLVVWATCARGEHTISEDTPRTVLEDSSAPKDLAQAGQAVLDSVLNAKPPAENPPQILKDIFAPGDIKIDIPVQDEKPKVASPSPIDRPVINQMSLDILNAKIPAKSPPQILKDILVTPRVQDDNPVIINPALNDKPVVNTLDSVLNAKPPAENPPQILKDILVTPRDPTNGRFIEDDKPLVNPTPIEPLDSTLNAKAVADAPQILKDTPLTAPRDLKPLLGETHVPVSPSPIQPLGSTLNAKAVADAPQISKDAPLVFPANPLPAPSGPSALASPLSPHSPSDRATLIDSSDPYHFEDLRRRLEDSLLEIENVIDEGSPTHIVTVNAGSGKFKSGESPEKEDIKPEKPAGHTEEKKTYAQIVGHLVEQLLGIPQLFIQSVREAIQQFTGVKVGVQVTSAGNYNPFSAKKESTQPSDNKDENIMTQHQTTVRHDAPPATV